MEKYEVEYLRHNFFEDAQRISATVSKSQLINLLELGSITVLSAKLKVELK